MATVRSTPCSERCAGHDFARAGVKLNYMARTKKAKGDQPPDEKPPADAASSEEAASESMAHVSSDVLAGSPDIFASTAEKPAANAGEPATAEEPPEATPAEPEPPAAVVDEPPAPVAEAPEEPAEVPAAAIVAVPPAAAPPPMPVATAPARQPLSTSTLALGVVMVVLGLFFLVVRVFDIDLSRYGWPLYVIIPGLTLLIVGYVSLGSGALIPGGIVTTAGLVLAYQSATEDWASWAYAWALVAPGGVGLGLFLQGLRNRDAGLIRQGRTLIFVAALIFMVGFVIFETIFNISNFDYGLFGKAALPGLLIVVGVILLARSLQRRRA
jgi:hypothetical protein